MPAFVRNALLGAAWLSACVGIAARADGNQPGAEGGPPPFAVTSAQLSAMPRVSVDGRFTVSAQLLSGSGEPAGTGLVLRAKLSDASNTACGSTTGAIFANGFE